MDVPAYNEILREKNKPFFLDDRFGRIASLLRDEDLVLFVGSGLSANKHKLWHDLVYHLCSECGVDVSEMNARNLSTKELLLWAQKAKDFNKTRYVDVLKTEYSDHTRTCSVYNVVSRIKARAYITLNFDELFYNSLVLDNSSLVPITSAFRTIDIYKQNLFHVHGRITEIETTGIVFTANDYDDAYQESNSRYDFMKMLFAQCNILFVGCGLKDPPFKIIFEQAAELRAKYAAENGECKNHLYTLQSSKFMKTSDGDKTKDEVAEAKCISDYAEKGIEVLFYDPIDPDNHIGLDQAMQNLRSEVCTRTAPTSAYAEGMRGDYDF